MSKKHNNPRGKFTTDGKGNGTFRIETNKVKNTELDLINHPQHYEGNIECIDAMEEVIGKKGVVKFCIGNAFKYLWRCRKKHDSPLEDLKKCRWYVSKAIELLTELEERNE